MAKKISTLVEDINSVIEGNGGWDETVHKFFTESVSSTVWRRLGNEREEREPTLRLSGMGTSCTRKLWYSINKPDDNEVFRASTLLKFLYGDLLEDLILSLAIAAGHDVAGMQDTLEVAGIKGHRDAVIDGITVDVKSASPYSFIKFKTGGLRDDDPFGYISQLSSYVYAGRTQTEVDSHPSLGAFLVVNKVSGELCLDMYDLGHEINTKEEEFEAIKAAVNNPEVVPDRGFSSIPDGKSGNMKLDTQCSYCAFKDMCWPGLRTFLYSGKPRFLTEVVREPKVDEIT